VWQEYLFPGSAEEALQMLAERRGRARIIAGGTDLVLQSQQGKIQATTLVDITRIPGLDFIEEREGYIYLGAQVTHAQIAASPLIRAKGDVLAMACGSVGGPQIRNMGTLVGNVVNALPAADGAVALFALDAETEVASLSARRWLPIAEVYQNVGVCVVDPSAEMITALRFPALQPRHKGAFQRLAPRRSLALPILNTAVVVGVQEGRFTEARIAIGPVAPTPFRAKEAEDVLIGQCVGGAVIKRAAELAAAAAQPRDSVLRGSKEYRKALVEVLVRRALAEAAGLWPRTSGGK